MAGACLDSLMSSFNARISELQELVVARNMYPASSVVELSAINASLEAMEMQVQAIKERLREEMQSIPKAKKLIDAALRQQKKLQKMSVHVPSNLYERTNVANPDSGRWMQQEVLNQKSVSGYSKMAEDPAPPPKENKGRSSAPLWYITSDELNKLTAYMRGRLTTEKINSALNDMATYADANAHLIAASKKKLSENLWEKALEIRDIAMTEAAKGKHFFLETDIKGPNFKLDNTGKAIITSSSDIESLLKFNSALRTNANDAPERSFRFFDTSVGLARLGFGSIAYSFFRNPGKSKPSAAR